MFKIGDFSKFTRVSIKMLRHYDEIGLLTPAFIDPETSYRYYTADQLPRLNRIIALKDLGFSLEQIGEMLENELSAAELRGMLRLRRGEIAQRLREEETRLASVEARLRQIDHEGQRPLYDIVLRAVEPQLIASIRQKVSTGSAEISELFDEVERFASRHGVRASRPPLMIYHDAEYQEEETEVEIAVPITKKVLGDGRTLVRELDGFSQTACVIHTGSYAAMDRALASLLNWVEIHGYAVAGALREVFLRFGADASDYVLPEVYLAQSAAEFVTELQLPLGVGG